MSAPVEQSFASLSVNEYSVPSTATAHHQSRPRKSDGTLESLEETFDDTVCAICLNKTPLTEAAQPDCCEHTYCACCILHWAVYKEKAWCPQCKAPFSSLLTYRTLDGELRDYPALESVCLLKCASWFQDHVKMRERAIAVAAGRPEGSVIDESDYVDYARFYDEYDDDEEVEAFYFSSAAGRARVVIGNRRHGPNGFISSGRMQARPAARPPQAKGKSQKAGEASSSARSGEAGPPRSAVKPAQPAGGVPPRGVAKGRHSLADDAADEVACKPGKQSAGRRARRNQRKAAADARAGF